MNLLVAWARELATSIQAYLRQQKKIHATERLRLADLGWIVNKAASHAGECCAVVLESLHGCLSRMNCCDGTREGHGCSAKNLAPSQAARHIFKKRTEAKNRKLGVGNLQG